VPASVLPKATARNSLKRKLYDSLSPRCKMQPYKDVVITVQGAARNAPIHAILEELSVLLG
jgi:RNase P protein component